MKTAIFYFTGTGNNYYVAKKIQQGLEDTDIYPFNDLENNPDMIHNYARIIYCVPVYYSHIPPYVKEVLLKTENLSEKENIGILCCGGNRGDAIRDMREGIYHSSKAMDGEYMIIMPANYILSYGAFPKIFQAIEFWTADLKIKRILKELKSSQKRIMRKPGIFYKPSSETRLQGAINEFSEIGSKYEVSNDCIQCGTCVNVCPVKNIHLENNKPVFSDNCQQCMACIQWCPKQCIDYNQSVKGRTRYHHRDITCKDMIR